LVVRFRVYQVLHEDHHTTERGGIRLLFIQSTPRHRL
jgi:hypothetical protein